MNPFQTIADPTLGGIDVPLTEMLLRLLVTLALASAIAYRPWRRALAQTAPLSVETAQAQVIIAVAGALMVIVIGDSTARAFGLVGLGAFIRFRSGIKDPRDAAVLFVMIGIGMAVGIGLLPVAGLAVLFVGSMLMLLELSESRPLQRVRVGIDLERPGLALEPIRPVFDNVRVLAAPHDIAGPGRLLLELDGPPGLDAATVLRRLERTGIPGVRGVVLIDP